MYSACRSRLATERHLSHATAKKSLLYLCVKMSKSTIGLRYATLRLIIACLPYCGRRGSRTHRSVECYLPVAPLRVFFSQVPLLFRGDARLSVLSALSVQIFVQGLLREG